MSEWSRKLADDLLHGRLDSELLYLRTIDWLEEQPSRPPGTDSPLSPSEAGTRAPGPPAGPPSAAAERRRAYQREYMRRRRADRPVPPPPPVPPPRAEVLDLTHLSEQRR